MNLKMLVLEANSTVSPPVLIGYTGEETRYATKNRSPQVVTTTQIVLVEVDRWPHWFMFGWEIYS